MQVLIFCRLLLGGVLVVDVGFRNAGTDAGRKMVGGGEQGLVGTLVLEDLPQALTHRVD